MPDLMKSYPTASVGQAEVAVYTAGDTVIASTLIGVLCANNNDAGAQKVSLRMKRGSNYYNVIKDAPNPVSDTFVPSGAEGKLVLNANDALMAKVDVGTIDVIVSMLEQTP